MIISFHLGRTKEKPRWNERIITNPFKKNGEKTIYYITPKHLKLCVE